VTGQSICEVMKPVADSVTEQLLFSWNSFHGHLAYYITPISAMWHPDSPVLAVCSRQSSINRSRTVLWRSSTGGDLTGAAHRMPPERCDPVFSDDVVKVAWMYIVDFDPRLSKRVCIGH